MDTNGGTLPTARKTQPVSPVLLDTLNHLEASPSNISVTIRSIDSNKYLMI